MISSAATPVRVVSVPSGHPYVRHLLAPDSTGGVVRLDDPAPVGAAAGRWWPPVVLDARWIRMHAADFDVFHVHFGTESYSVDHLREVVDALRDVGRPLVYTVHDLTNPQLVDQTLHLEHLDLLVPAADEVLTLTPGAAAVIAERWGRRATVVAHPNILPFEASAPTGSASPNLVAGMHLRDLRPNIDAVRATATLLGAVDALRSRGHDTVARIHINDRVRDEDARAEVTRLVEASPSSARLVTEPRLSDDDLAASLADLDVAVLPYRHGTHSGWVELCFDLGVPVVGPRVGFAAEQHPRDFASFDAGDVGSLAEALERAVAATGVRAGSDERSALIESRRAMRRVQRHEIEGIHRLVYDRVLPAVVTA